VEEQIIFENRIFCFTGEFENYTRDELFNLVVKYGGLPAEKMTLDVHYLIYGSVPNPHFKYGAFGNKYKTAHEMLASKIGNIIGIFPEDIFLSSLENTTLNANRLLIKSDSLKLLKRISPGKPRMKRSEILLRPLDASNYDWSFYVPNCFNEELDIRQTIRTDPVKDANGDIVKKANGKPKTIQRLVWTQGNFFTFQKGDTIYDTSLAYQEWGHALKHIKRMITIKYAQPVEFEEWQNKRSPGEVIFSLTIFQNGELKESENKTLTQDEFVKYLIDG